MRGTRSIPGLMAIAGVTASCAVFRAPGSGETYPLIVNNRTTFDVTVFAVPYEGSATLTRSPILIDNRGKLVTISVVRRPIDPAVAIHLKLKVPANIEVLGAQVQPKLIAPTQAPAGTPADNAANVEISEGDVIRVDSQLVALNVSVIDRGTNRGFAGLVQSDFKLFENHNHYVVGLPTWKEVADYILDWVAKH